MEMELNHYSRQWFQFFHVGIDDERTTREIEFVENCAPLPAFAEILDVCCGMGRHARELSRCGYTVTGIDRDPAAIAHARKLGGGAKYVVADIREYQPEPERFDVAIVIGQSFGHFDSATNREILKRLGCSVRKPGRVILDVWNPEFFGVHQGERELKTSSGVVRETKHVKGGRLFVELMYPGGNHEHFQWQLFTPEQVEGLAKEVELDLLIACCGFDTTSFPSPLDPRLQYVLAR